jgi:hypothetical protein
MHAAEHDVVGLGAGGRVAGQLERVAGDVGELDHLVTLVVVAQHEHPIAQRRLRRPRPSDQIRVRGRRQVTGAVDATLGVRVAALSQQ